MKKNIHPSVNYIKAHCACGGSYDVISTRDEISIDICASCHPFFTGQQKFVDRAGRIEKFQKRFEKPSRTA